MNAKIKLAGVLVAIGVVSLAMSGCFFLVAGAAAGAGGVAYVEGKLTESVKANPDKVVAATVKAFNSLKYTLIVQEAYGQEGRVTGSTRDDTDVKVDIRQEGVGISKISIRFGTFGDEVRSRILMDEIKRRL